MATKHLTAKKNGALWIQPYGAAEAPKYLGCHDLGDITEPRGDSTPEYCFDAQGNYVQIGATHGAPDNVGTTLETYLGLVQDWLEDALPPFNLFVLEQGTAKKDSFTNWGRAFILQVNAITSYGATGLVKRNEDATSMHSFEITANNPILRAFALTAERMAITNTNALNAVAVNRERRQAGNGVAALKIGTKGAISASASAGTADVLVPDSNGNFAASAADPFAATETGGAILRLVLSPTTERLIVARQGTVAGKTAQIAISDDNGATWSVVNVGAVTAQFFVRAGCLYAIDSLTLWGVTSGGYIYKSTDGGATWSTVDAGAISAQNFSQIKFVGSDIGWICGANNAILRTRNGGRNWAAITGPAGQSAVTINAIAPVTESRVFLAYNDGKLYKTENALETTPTWTLVDPAWAGTSPSLTGIDFLNEMQGIVVRTESSVGKIYQTIDGGNTWQAVVTPTNAGFNDVQFVAPNLALAVGPASGGTGVLVRAYA